MQTGWLHRTRLNRERHRALPRLLEKEQTKLGRLRVRRVRCCDPEKIPNYQNDLDRTDEFQLTVTADIVTTKPSPPRAAIRCVSTWFLNAAMRDAPRLENDAMIAMNPAVLEM